MTKTAEKPTLWGRTYVYSPYKGVPPGNQSRLLRGPGNAQWLVRTANAFWAINLRNCRTFDKPLLYLTFHKTWLRVLQNMHYNACAENAFDSSCSGWWSRIAAVPYFLDRTWPLNQCAYKKKETLAAKLRYHHIITMQHAESTILT